MATMAVIEQSLGHHEEAAELFNSALGSKHAKNNSIVMLRVYSNMTMMEIY